MKKIETMFHQRVHLRPKVHSPSSLSFSHRDSICLWFEIFGFFLTIANRNFVGPDFRAIDKTTCDCVNSVLTAPKQFGTIHSHLCSATLYFPLVWSSALHLPSPLSELHRLNKAFLLRFCRLEFHGLLLFGLHGNKLMCSHIANLCVSICTVNDRTICTKILSTI